LEEEERSPGDGVESSSKRGVSEGLPREGLHLDVCSKIPLPRSKIPTTPKSAPARHVPDHSWSLARDEHTPSPRHNTYSVSGSSPQSRSTDSSLNQSQNSHFLNQSAVDSLLNQSGDSSYKDSSYIVQESGDSPFKVDSNDLPYKVLETGGDMPYKVLDSADSPYKARSSGDSPFLREQETGDSPFLRDGSTGDSPFLRHPSSSRLPFVPLQDKSSSSGSGSGSTSTDSDGSIQEGEGRRARKKNYEAFVMTGDRMINLAKTPAHMDFQSKYYRPTLEPAKASSSSLPASPVEPTEDKAVNVREQPSVRRSLVRNSKSEDQLALDHSDQFLQLDEDDKLGSSCHTLLDNSDSILDASQEQLVAATPARPSASRPPHVSSESSSSRSPSKGSSTDQLISSQPSDEACSPDFSTSSLISCSEHYNGESLLDNMSPQSPSSPDTPEWSLIANGESFHKDVSVSSHTRKSSRKEKKESKSSSHIGQNGERSNNNDSMITNRDNRVIITIGNTNGHEHQVNGMSSPGTSSGTITPDLGYSELQEEAPSLPATSPPPLHPPSPNISSEEESDMDSLHSYHPPVKVVDIPSAVRLGKRLYNLEGFRKSDVSRHLSKNNDFSRAVAEEYCKLFSFSDLTLDAALRAFLVRFSLTGETQERERVLLHFSKRFLECNPNKKGPDAFQSHDSVHTLTCAIMLLNTDLHSDNLQRRMTPEEFVENLAELNDGQNFPDDLLKNIYFSIKVSAIEWVLDEEEEQESVPLQRATPSSPETNSSPSTGDVSSSVNLSGSQAGGFNPFLTLPDPNTAVDYKRGYVMRKCCFDAHGKKTKMGKRGWKMFYLTLRDMVLYCFKDEKSMRTPGAFESNANAVRVHHAVAISAIDYTKKQFVFRLGTSDQAEFLFQTSDDKELMTWVETINTVVARYSSPPLPAPCSNSSKFQRPLLPSSRSNLSLGDQVASHRRQVSELSQELSDHTANPLPRGTKSGMVVQFREKAEFLSGEIARYSVYAAALEAAAHKQENNQMASSPLKAITS